MADHPPTISPDDGERYYNNALHWIRQTALLHYIGDAFDPVHMREIANFATMVLRGEPITDYDATTERAKVEAAKMMALFDQSEDAE